jgi:hypothetical protein
LRLRWTKAKARGRAGARSSKDEDRDNSIEITQDTLGRRTHSIGG